MAGSRRLTRNYFFQGKKYGPETPVKEIPQEIADREKELNSPEFKKKHDRRYGTAVPLPTSDLIKKVEAPIEEEDQEPETLGDGSKDEPDEVE